MIYLFRLFSYLKNYKRHMVISMFFLIISVVLNMIQPKLIEWVIDNGIGAGLAGNIFFGAAGILLLGLVGNAASLFSGFSLIKAGQGLSHEIRSDLFKKILSFSFVNFDKWRTGELMVRLNSDVNTVRMFVRMGLFMIVQSIVTILGSVIFMFLTDIRLATIMSAIMGATLVLSLIFVSVMRPLFMKIRIKLDELNNTLQENLAGSKVVRAFNRQGYEVNKFSLKNRDIYKISLKVGYLFGTFMPFMLFLGNMSVTLILWLGGTEIINNYNSGTSGFTLGQLIAFNNYAMMSIFPLVMLGMVLNFVSMASASAERIFKLMQEVPDIEAPASPVPADRIRGGIKINAVSFGYGDGENALSDINLEIKPGEKIGLIGGTGSGKSSLANLIPRLYEPRKGTILIDGVDIKQYDPSELRRRIGIVLQDTVLFSGGIRGNILYGNPGGDQKEAERAAKIAQALPFIEEKGWDTSVGEKGAGLSGGQRQRVAIARAIATNPSIIILDDVTSSLDLETERNVTRGIYDELNNATVLIISQKIRTIKESDRIVVMDKGRIIGTGTHKELLETSDIYRRIAETQNEYIQ
ncbi:MAG: ABC transporter ATP-binding protein [Deltaproteobacteria bacterium]|nr:ABC transporter ATP-binding protein [Deltaproteobacteria bacterium]